MRVARSHMRLHTQQPPRRGALPFSVDPNGDWKSCTDTVPKDCEVIGTVSSEGVTGALVRLPGSRNFIKVVGGQIAPVNAIKVQQALAAHRNREVQSALEMVSVEEFDDK